MPREIMKEIKELILKGYSGRQIQAMGYAESTVRRVGDNMALRGELPGMLSGITGTLREELLRADNAQALREIRRELRERGFAEGSISAVVSKLRKKGKLLFGQSRVPTLRKGAKEIESNRISAQLWEEYREEKARLLSEYKGKAAQLLKHYEEKIVRKKSEAKDIVRRLQAEIEARDRLLKKLMERLSQLEENQTKEEVNHEGRRP